MVKNKVRVNNIMLPETHLKKRHAQPEVIRVGKMHPENIHYNIRVYISVTVKGNSRKKIIQNREIKCLIPV